MATATTDAPVISATSNGVTVTSRMTPTERFQAHLTAQGAQLPARPERVVTGPPSNYQTPETLRRLAQGEATANVDHKAVATMQAAFSTLDARQRETHRGAFEADLSAIYAGKKSPGNFTAALDRAQREQRVQDALNAALRENKSPEELKQVIDSALTSTGAAKNEKHVTGDAAIEVFTKHIAALSIEQQSAMDKAEFQKFYVQIRNEGYAVRTLSNGSLQVYDPRGSSELAGRPRTADGKFAPAHTPSPHSPQVWAEAHVSVADKAGFIPLNRINTNGLSGYTLPKLIEGQTYHVGVFQELANARAAGVSQKQVDDFVRAGMVRDGWIKT